MPDPKQIPHLLQFLDEDSSSVREDILKALKGYGPVLWEELERMDYSLNPAQWEVVQSLYTVAKRQWVRASWRDWLDIQDERQKLERALAKLAVLLYEPEAGTKLLAFARVEAHVSALLDGLAMAFRTRYAQAEPQRLARFLFKEYGLDGNRDDYYDPQNSSLISVIEEKVGIPLSLACVYILIGHRLELDITGCNFPGHFLARFVRKGENIFVDCFSQGQVVDREAFQKNQEGVGEGLDSVFHEKASAETMIRRTLANLIRAYQLLDDDLSAQVLIDLFKMVDTTMADKKMAAITPEDIINGIKPKHGPGEFVRHRRYTYRGIIVDCDSQCLATDQWYYGNYSQPNRDQPWYHVLVDGSDQVTYVAESNLTSDVTEEAIAHPLLSYFFTKTPEGKYIRNDNAWPDVDL